MKVFDSGMPEEAYWNSLFDIPLILTRLGITAGAAPVVEIGCGYGTFTLPVARAVGGEVHAFDIERGMIERASGNARISGLANVTFHERDVLASGTGLPAGSVRPVLLFNILHSRSNPAFLAEAGRILVDGGSVCIIHWRKDIVTPRGPRWEDRPDRSSIIEDAAGLGLQPEGEPCILEPYHWGTRLRKGG